MNVALIGTGLIGGSIGLRLKQVDPSTDIIGFDKDPRIIGRAIQRGAADRAASSLEEAVKGRDIVFVAVPVRAISALVADALSAASPGTILTDVGSTKSQLVVDIEASLPSGVHFIGGHPMAGTEDEGIDAARADLFEGAWWILTPTSGSDAAAYGRLNQVVATLGARTMALEAAEHDRLMAVISHLPQLVASTLMNMAAEQGKEHAGLLALAAGGFKDVTRIAASNPEIWVDICQQNAAAIAEVLSRMSEQLLQLRDQVQQGDVDAIGAKLTAARAARRSLPEREVAGQTFDVRFPVPDRPGVLAEVTTTVGNLGINIEDLRIVHSTEGGRGTLHLTIVGEGPARRVVDALRTRGYEAKGDPA